MCLAEPNAGMNVERVKHDGLAMARYGHLSRRGMSKGVAATDYEGLERQTRVEGRAAQSFVRARAATRVPQVAPIGLQLAYIPLQGRQLGHFGF